MLENLAIQYVSQPEPSLRAISYGMMIAGGLGAAFFHKGTAELQRAPYFAYIGFLALIAAGSQFVWFGVIPAMTGGFLWVLMLVDVIATLGIGYAAGVIAMARSRDAYGHARLAFLAFIPIANLWLLGIPSKKGVSANRSPTIPLLTGALGVLTGLVLLFVGVAMGTFVQLETKRIVSEAENDPAMQQVGIDMMLRGLGLEETIRQIAAGVPSRRMDETTTLLRVLGDGRTLRFVYEVSTNLNALPTSLRAGLVRQNCNYEGIRPVIEAGATIEHFYQRPDGTRIGVVTVTRDTCRE
jgi:uncharacterized protein YneF (UPF0154 family)